MSADESVPGTAREQTSHTASGSSPQDLMLFVQSIKGAPASVLLALAITGRHMSHKELQLWTRCGKDQVTFALQSLVRVGWATGRTSRGPWALVRALAVPVILNAGGPNPLKGLSGGGDSLNPPERGTTLPSAHRKELLSAMADFGIREPTASELADLPHMNLEYLRSHVEAVRPHGLRVGAAIQAMRLAAPPPARPAARNRQAEVEEKIRRFVEGG